MINNNNKKINLNKLKEPELMFGFEQKLEDPRDGLSLFGPFEKSRPLGIQWGIIGTKDGFNRFKNWVKKIQGPISNIPPDIARPPFPGFEAVFGIPWEIEPVLRLEVTEEEIRKNLYLSDKHQRVYNTVEIFSDKIEKSLREEDKTPNIWFVIIPDEIYKYCRPLSSVEAELKIEPEYKMSIEYAKSIRSETKSLFEIDNKAAIPYEYEVNFHNQLKARLLEKRVVIQIIRESTIAYEDFKTSSGRAIRDLDKLQSAIAWNISTTAFYKAGGMPWKVGTIRDGVCYIGLVFKQNPIGGPKSACCAAQMFLDSGDGVVFRGAVGNFHDPVSKTYHLNFESAQKLVEKAINAYKEKKGSLPKELFIHGKTSFSYEEWEGFQKGGVSSINIVCVRIKDAKDLKFYRKGKYPVVRGIAYIIDEKFAYLCTKGFIPRLQTSTGLEVPRPLEITICRGEADIEVVLKDIMMLTKLNYNACIFGDGWPVTLKFADAVGEILTAGPIQKLDVPPLSFKFYI